MIMCDVCFCPCTGFEVFDSLVRRCKVIRLSLSLSPLFTTMKLIIVTIIKIVKQREMSETKVNDWELKFI